MTKKKIKCDRCGKIFKPGYRDGVPNGLGFVLDGGKIINFCRECIEELGSLDEEGKDAYFASLGLQK